MQIPAHLLSGWIFGNSVPLQKNERLWCMVAATVPDLDGLGIFHSAHAYVHYHHLLGHGWFAAVILSIIAAIICKRRLLMAGLTCVVVHIHILLDLLGSGRAWGIVYNYPFSTHKTTWSWGWEFQSWQNTLGMGIIILITIIIAIRSKRTPFETIVPAVDRSLFHKNKDGKTENKKDN